MAPPPGYQLHENSSHVCPLKKSLYGLKKSPRAWFEKFSSTLLAAGYSQSEGDHTLFFKRGRDHKISILIVYVDDIIVIGNDTTSTTYYRANVFVKKEGIYELARHADKELRDEVSEISKKSEKLL